MGDEPHTDRTPENSGRKVPLPEPKVILPPRGRALNSKGGIQPDLVPVTLPNDATATTKECWGQNAQPGKRRWRSRVGIGLVLATLVGILFAYAKIGGSNGDASASTVVLAKPELPPSDQLDPEEIVNRFLDEETTIEERMGLLREPYDPVAVKKQLEANSTDLESGILALEYLGQAQMLDIGYHGYYVFSDEEEYSSFVLQSPDCEAILFGHARRYSVTEKVILGAVKKALTPTGLRKVLMTVRLESIDDSHRNRQFLVSHIVATSWVASTVGTVEQLWVDSETDGNLIPYAEFDTLTLRTRHGIHSKTLPYPRVCRAGAGHRTIAGKRQGSGICAIRHSAPQRTDDPSQLAAGDG